MSYVFSFRNSWGERKGEGLFQKKTISDFPTSCFGEAVAKEISDIEG